MIKDMEDSRQTIFPNAGKTGGLPSAHTYPRNRRQEQRDNETWKTYPKQTELTPKEEKDLLS